LRATDDRRREIDGDAMSKSDTYDRGLALGKHLGGESFNAVVERLEEIDPDLSAYLVADAYGKVMSRGGLPLADRELCIVSALAAQGYLPQLQWHIGAALNSGVSPDAIREALIQVIPYAGWPAALNALGTMKVVFTERNIPLRPSAPTTSQAADDKPILQQGRERGGEVYGDYAAVERLLAEYDPSLPSYLTEGAYGHIYGRAGLDMRRRELIAVAMLTAQQRLQQLARHVEGAHRVGASPAETKEVIMTMLLYAGWPAALNALEVWRRSVAHQP
jgi:4-carboxymuconolactone decarboxylase